MNQISRKRLLLGGLALAALLIFLWRSGAQKSADAAARITPAAIAVDTAAVNHYSDVPIYLQGLGTVQAFYTVTVTARVDGELQKIAFTEGQNVHKGDLLAQIDPRPNQAAYEQAVATKAKDNAAAGRSAKRDLARYTLLQPQNLASKQTVDTARASVDQLEAQVKVDQAIVDNARTQLDYTRASHRRSTDAPEPSTDRSRQYRACRGHDGHRRRHSGTTDLGRFSRCPEEDGLSAGGARCPRRRTRARSRRCRATASPNSTRAP